MKRKYWILAIAALVVVVAAGVLLFTSIGSSGRAFTADLTGAAEVPATSSAATGQAVFRLSADGNSMTFTLTVSNINNVSASHIHLAPSGAAGPVVVPLFAGPKAGLFSGVLAEGTITQANLTGQLLGQPLSALVARIEAGNAYVNVHTTQNPPGEIRGQIRTAP